MAEFSWNEAYESGEYLAEWDYAYPSQELVAIIALGIIPAGATALDVGCGAGREAIFLAQQGFKTIGVDASPKALAIAAARAVEAGVSVDWRCADVRALPLENNTVDFVNDRGCFHHFGDDDSRAYAREIGRVLKRGGCFLLRGCRKSDMPPFVPITETAVKEYFGDTFVYGPVLPITLISDAGKLDSNIVVLKKK